MPNKRPTAPRPYRPPRDEVRGTAHERGYTSRWQNRTRPMYLRRHPLCQVCEFHGRTTPAAEVHHILPISQGGAVHDFDNLLAVCHRCHRHVERHGLPEGFPHR